MRIIDSGVLATGSDDGPEACNTFPAIATLSDGTILVTCRSGKTKDCDAEHIRLFRSGPEVVFEEVDSPFEPPSPHNGTGSFKLCYLTEIADGEILAAALWVDRTSYPGCGLFNEATEGCLPMAVMIARSTDNGRSWTPFEPVHIPDEIGPPSLTNPIVRLPNGELLLSIETNKNYNDSGPWKQRAVLFRSLDKGRTWNRPQTVAEDPAGRLCHWDQRIGVRSDNTVCTFCWMYDRIERRYLPIRRRLSPDGGRSWGTFDSLGFADQPAHPAVTPDGRILLAYVDRFGTPSIRARFADSIEVDFADDREIVLYSHIPEARPDNREAGSDEQGIDSTGELLGEMSLWSFGLPFGEILPNGEALVVYYAGTDRRMDIRYSRIAI